MKDQNEQERDHIYSEKVRAGKRTYFFDVKATKSNDYYLTITESKRKQREDETFFYEKHKIFLYKEDFNKFIKALDTTVNHVKEELMPEVDFSQFDREWEAEDKGEPTE